MKAVGTEIKKIQGVIVTTLPVVISFTRNIVITTYDEAKTCIRNGSVQQCLSTCGIAGDAIPGVGNVVAIGCDTVNGLVYLAKGDRIQAGLSAVAIIPYVGTIAKQGSKPIVKLAGEAAGKVGVSVIKRNALPNNAATSLSEWERLNFKTGSRNLHSGGTVFKNDPIKLPVKSDSNYWKEYDVNQRPQGSGPIRDTERFVKDQNGELYYTNNHYGYIKNGQPDFWEIK